MLDHVSLGVSDIDRSRHFYDATLRPLGLVRTVNFGKGLVAGGRNEGAPGLRPHYHADYYAAFVFDPDGHRIEAVCHAPENPMTVATG